jgi:hypothetical protein
MTTPALQNIHPAASSEVVIVQVVETQSGIVYRELDATGQDPERVAEAALRNLDCFRYSSRVKVRSE